MEPSRVAVLIPALNEARTIAEVVAAVRPHGRPIVVDDGSTDRTAELARGAGAEVVRLDTNRGYDGALDAGFARAAAIGADCLVTIDADGQHDPDLIRRFVEAIDAGADVVVGVRDRHQRFGEQVFAWIGAAVWGVRDPLCGMKAYRREVYLAQGCFDSYRSIGTQLCLFAVRHGCRIGELPVRTRPRGDAPRFGSGWRPNLRILRALGLGLVRFGWPRKT